MIIEGLNFKKTCDACPEQYDVFKGDKMVGYVRLRWGVLSCCYPNYDGEEIYSKSFDDAWQGEFDDDNERNKYLIIIAKELNNYMEKNENA
jgi:hypothetical protein